ncbi:ATP-binding protein [Chryseobacterium sp. ERMR1:04]|uniref:ATP-binding protein n=1 Tax=Chryseobacterium sp. ERMR1:04 TaxID=1705393 RepID=UPI0006C86BD1|nr:ATP-binding protein [Chryseobacterium sp. ERMR1:04]KPH15130.1 hypothetical protein AMQ68_06970 [Chryseobacterium sp. ERMR1:04]
MNKIKFEKFKAFQQQITLELNNKNILLYGENGSGKSSIYECLKIIFFKDRIEKNLSTEITPEEYEQNKSDLWASYNNKINNQNFEIIVNEINHNTFDTKNYQAFMISLEEIFIENNINLISLLEKLHLNITDIRNLCNEHYLQVQENVNETLLQFKEDIKIEIDNEDDFAIKIIDPKKNLERKSDIKKFFNEAKLNLIVLLLIFNVILIAQDTSKKRILILDDFITSLDSSNRTFIAKYVLEKFSEFQSFILTHNISFFNLIVFLVREIVNNQNWIFGNLYEINNQHKLYLKNNIERVSKIKEDYLSTTQDIEEIGNRIRKKFEILLYEFSKILMIGAVEDSKKILERLTNGKPVYYKDGNTASDLIDELQNIITVNNNLSANLNVKISQYKNAEFSNFQHILKELKLYQKVTMHPMSHGTLGMVTFTTNEITQSLELLEKMEKFLKDFVEKNITTI